MDFYFSSRHFPRVEIRFRMNVNIKGSAPASQKTLL